MFHEMMAYLSWLEHCISEILLLFLVGGSFVLPSVTSQICHYVFQQTDPRVKIISSPSSNTLPFGVPLNLTCIASQNDELPGKYIHLSRPVSIQWFGPHGVLNRCQREAQSPPAAAMRCLLMVGALTSGKFGNYSCQASGNHRCSTKRIEIFPHESRSPEIVQQPMNQTAVLGSNVTFSCTTTGHPKPAITWAKDNALYSLEFNPRAKVMTDDGKSLSQLIITRIKSEDYGKYQCVANNSVGVKASRGAFLYPGTVDIQRPEFVDVPANQTASIGSTVTFNCSATGHPKPTITWTKNNDSYSVQSSPRAKIITDDDKSPSRLVITGVTSEDYGKYQCVANNSAGVKESQVAFLYPGVVESRSPEIVQQPMNQTAVLGSNVTFSCTATGHPKPAIIWAKDNDLYSLELNPRAKVMTDGDKSLSQLVMTGIKSEDYGKYQCVANNSAGVKASRGAFLFPGTVDIEGPEFIDVPANQTASIGSTVTFNCSATGHPKPTITWTKDNDSHSVQSSPRAKIITDDDKSLSQLVITGVTSEDYGKYQCVANNSAGVKESQVAFLYPGVVAPTPSRRLERASSSKAKIFAIVVPSVIVALMICGLCGFLRYLRSGRARDAEIPLTSIICTESVERISLPCELTSSEANNTPLREDTGNAFDIAEGPESPIPVQESEKIQLPGVEIHPEEHPLLGELTVEILTRTSPQARQLCPVTGLGDTPPKRPPKPRRKESTEHKVVCSCMVESRSRNPKLEKSDIFGSKDSGYDSAESRENICIDQEIVLEINEGWEIDLNRLEVKDEVLGEGQFGIVFKGRYCRDDGNVIDVAVKQLKDSTSVTNRADLLGEMQILKQAGRHPNIVSLVGACTQEENILVVTELIPRGSLESLLKSKHAPGEENKYVNLNCEFNDRELLKIALQIASGMQHLEESKCIHRDLAARNVFIDDNKVAKVGDFGMARDISNDGIYTKTSNGKVPWRWSSLESLRDGIYTSQSDVWSFGIVLWEMTTYGELPYPDITTPSALMSFLSSGKRMPRPDHCCVEMYALMSSCWKENPLMRPTFAGITKQLQKYLAKEHKRTYVNIKNDDISSDVEV